MSRINNYQEYIVKVNDMIRDLSLTRNTITMLENQLITAKFHQEILKALIAFLKKAQVLEKEILATKNLDLEILKNDPENYMLVKNRIDYNSLKPTKTIQESFDEKIDIIYKSMLALEKCTDPATENFLKEFISLEKSSISEIIMKEVAVSNDFSIDQFVNDNTDKFELLKKDRIEKKSSEKQVSKKNNTLETFYDDLTTTLIVEYRTETLKTGNSFEEFFYKKIKEYYDSQNVSWIVKRDGLFYCQGKDENGQDVETEINFVDFAKYISNKRYNILKNQLKKQIKGLSTIRLKTGNGNVEQVNTAKATVVNAIISDEFVKTSAINKKSKRIIVKDFFLKQLRDAINGSINVKNSVGKEVEMKVVEDKGLDYKITRNKDDEETLTIEVVSEDNKVLYEINMSFNTNLQKETMKL